MMFANLLQFWKTKDFLSDVLSEFQQMLDNAEKMFAWAQTALLENVSGPGLAEKIYVVDKEVNELEKNIRKKVVEHLVLRPASDVPMSLLLMSVVKDAERLGDYAKNLFQVTKLLQQPININQYKGIFNNIEGEISDLFKRTKQAFMESDSQQAEKSWQTERDIVKRCDQIITRLAGTKLAVNESVCFTLIARYYKRLAAHLTNIATSVILPISDLDYYDEKRIEQ